MALCAASVTNCSRRPRNRASAPSTSMPICSSTSFAKAVSISPIVPAFKIWSLQPQRGRRLARVSRNRIGIWVVRIYQHGGDGHVGKELMDQAEPFLSQVGGKKVHAGNIAARPIETGDQAELNRIGTIGKDDRNSRRRCLRGKRWSGRTCGKDHGRLKVNQIGHHRG